MSSRERKSNTVARASHSEMTAEFVDAEEGDALRWVQPGVGNRYHELKSDKGVLAKLKWKGMYGSLAYVLTNEGIFTLKRAGFLNPYVTVRRKAGISDLAKFDVDLGITGTIEFTEGPRFEVKRPSMIRRRWVVVNWNDEPLFTIVKKKGGRYSADVPMSANPRETKHMMLICAIVWYAFILSAEEWNFESEGQHVGTGA